MIAPSQVASSDEGPRLGTESGRERKMEAVRRTDRPPWMLCPHRSLPRRTSSGLAKPPRMKKPFEAGSKGLGIVRGGLSQLRRSAATTIALSERRQQQSRAQSRTERDTIIM